MSLAFIDLTHTIKDRMPVYPGSAPVRLCAESDLAHDSFNEIRLEITTHTGTHIDCPRHFFAGGADLISKTPDSFYGKGLALDCTGLASAIDKSHLMKYERKIRTCDFLLLATGWSKNWFNTGYFSGFPVLNEEAAEYLASFSLKGIGCDTGSFDKEDSVTYPVHNILLSKGFILIENLDGPEKLIEKEFVFSCFPLKILDGDGSPVRAVAIVTDPLMV